MVSKIKKIISFALGIGILFGSNVVSVSAESFDTSQMAYFNGHYYKVYTDATSWIDAKNKCELLGGHLATITSEEEDDFTYKLMEFEGINKVLFGLYNAGDSEMPNWCWVTNEPLNYTRWGDGEPNYDYNGTEAYGGYYCGAWNDYRNDEVGAYICEWDSIPYKSIEYHITYNANGGSNAPSSQKFTSDSKVKISLQKPVRSGYIFKGWGKTSKSTDVSYYSGKSYIFSENMTLYAIWKKASSCVDNKNISILDKRIKKSAVLFADIFAKKAKSSDETMAQSAAQQLKNLENQVTITGYEGNVPDEVLEAFAKAVLNTLNDAKIEKYETNTDKLTLQIYNQIKDGVKNISQTITIGSTTYTVNCTILAQSYGHLGVQASWANVTWRDKKNKTYFAYIVSNSTDESMKKALASYCAVLAQLNKDIWKDFLTNYVTGGWKIAGLNDVKELDDKTVSKFFDHSEKLIQVICGDKKAKKIFVNDASGNLKEKLSKMTKRQFRKFIKKNVPMGDEIVKAADQYKKVSDKYSDYKKYLRKWKKSNNDRDLIKCEKAYDECQKMMDSLDTILGQLSN